MGCSGPTESIINAIKNLDGIDENSDLSPVPSNIIEHMSLYYPELVDEEDLVVLQYEENRRYLHRKADPFNPKQTLKFDASEKDLLEWAEKYKVLDFVKRLGKNSIDLYKITPEELLCQSKQLLNDQIHGIVLHFRLHLWESTRRYTDAELFDTILNNADFVYELTKEELWTIMKCDDERITEEIRVDCGEQYEMLWEMENKFFEWQSTQDESTWTNIA